MKKGIILSSLVNCALAAILVFSAAGLSRPKADEFKWPPMLRVATPTTQSASFASTNGWAPILTQDLGVNVRVVPEDSEFRRMARFAVNKEFELNSVSIAEIASAFEGTDGYKVQRAAPVVITWFQNDTPWGFAVRGDSDFNTVYDLKKPGVRVAVSTQSSPMMTAIQQALPAFIGWSPEEAEANWTWVPAGSYPDNCRTIPDGRADVAYVTPISGITFEMEAHPRGLRWLSMPIEDVDGWNRFMDIRPTVLPVKADFGVKSAHGVEMLASAFLYASTPDRDEEMVYRLAKWFHEAFDSYKGVHAIAPRMSIERFRSFLNNCPLPIAEGTIRYLREIGVWTEADDQWNKEAHELMNRWIAARNAAIDEAEANRVRLHYENEDFLKIFNKHTADIPVFRTRIQ